MGRVADPKPHGSVTFAGIRIKPGKDWHRCIPVGSVADPEQHGSVTFAWIRNSEKFKAGSGSGIYHSGSATMNLILGMHRISGWPDIRSDNPAFFISGIRPDTGYGNRITGRISSYRKSQISG